MLSVFKLMKGYFSSDPVRSCKRYKKEGCAHVDGILCNMKTCTLLMDFNAINGGCPSCGYYCICGNKEIYKEDGTIEPEIEKENNKMFYGLTNKQQAHDMTDAVVECLGGGGNAKLLILETMAQETRLGAYRDPTKDGAGRGITQFDKGIVADTVNRARQSEIDDVNETFGIDLWMVDHDDLDFAPLPCIILTRLKYKRIPEAIPSTIKGRAEYWKKHYNTVAGKGTVEEYIENAKLV